MAQSNLLTNVPFVEALSKGGKQRPSHIIIKTSGTTSKKGAALAIANLWHKDVDRNPSHYVLDEGTVYRCVPENMTAGSEDNDVRRAIVVTICSEFVPELHLWGDSSQIKVLDQAADLISRLMFFYKIPPRYLNEESSSRWSSNRGVLVQVRGSWPYEAFMGDVRGRILAIKRGK